MVDFRAECGCADGKKPGLCCSMRFVDRVLAKDAGYFQQRAGPTILRNLRSCL
jgi:hypothetical protein